jgi:hypothetical protein
VFGDPWDRTLQDFDFELILDGSTHAAGLLVDQINRSRLLAKETSRLKYLGDYSVDKSVPGRGGVRVCRVSV